MRGVFIVAHKEIFDSLRDHRSVLMALLFPLLGPLTMALTITLMSKTELEKLESPVTVLIQGEEHAPNLMQFLTQHKVTLVHASGDIAAQVRSGRYDVGLVVPPTFATEFRSGKPAPVRIIVDQSRHAARTTYRRIERLLEGYGLAVGRLRLLARGLDPAISEAIAIETHDLSTPESRAAMLFAMFPMFLVMALFMGGFSVAIDTTAGELERGSLEPLFLNPVPRSHLVVGKFLAALFFSLVGLLVTTAGFGIVPEIVSTEGLGLSVRLEPRMLGSLVLLVLPLSALATSLQMIVATFSRGFREAQALLSFLLLIPMAPGILLAVAPFESKPWMMAVPLLSEQVLLYRLIRGDPLAPSWIATCVVTTSLAAALSLLIAARLYSGDRMFIKGRLSKITHQP